MGVATRMVFMHILTQNTRCNTRKNYAMWTYPKDPKMMVALEQRLVNVYILRVYDRTVYAYIYGQK